MFRKIFALTMALTTATFGISHYYATASDNGFYDSLINLIGSIHRFDSENLGEIAVFDLGLSEAQVKKLETIRAVTVHTVELPNPQALDRIMAGHRLVIGHFSWKPAVIKQACELFPYFLYLDAGLSILKNPDDLFEHIIEHGYFLIDSGWPLSGHTPKYVLDNLILTKFSSVSERLLDKSTLELTAGLQGMSRRMYSSYILPVYEFAKDIRLFEDDGKAPRGPGFGRNDQTIFSIMAHSLNLRVHHMGSFELEIGGTKKIASVEWDASQISSKTIIKIARQRDEKNLEFIKMKNSLDKFVAKSVCNFTPISGELKEKLDLIHSCAFSTNEALYNTYQLSVECIKKDIPGDLVECGVAAGAHPAAMALACQQLEVARKIHLFDSFQGIPLASPNDDVQPGIGTKPAVALAAQKQEDFLVSSGICCFSVDQVKRHMTELGINQTNLIYHPGWFQYIIPTDHALIKQIAVLRLSGSLYESTKVCLKYLYSKVSKGGYVIAADYGSFGCKKAIHEYLGDHHLRPVIISIDGGNGAAYWQVK